MKDLLGGSISIKLPKRIFEADLGDEFTEVYNRMLEYCIVNLDEENKVLVRENSRYSAKEQLMPLIILTMIEYNANFNQAVNFVRRDIENSILCFKENVEGSDYLQDMFSFASLLLSMEIMNDIKKEKDVNKDDKDLIDMNISNTTIEAKRVIEKSGILSLAERIANEDCIKTVILDYLTNPIREATNKLYLEGLQKLGIQYDFEDTSFPIDKISDDQWNENLIIDTLLSIVITKAIDENSVLIETVDNINYEDIIKQISAQIISTSSGKIEHFIKSCEEGIEYLLKIKKFMLDMLDIQEDFF